MIQGLKALQQYLEQNNMKSTLHTLRAELLCRIPNKPSQQFYQLFQQSNPQATKNNINSKNYESNTTHRQNSYEMLQKQKNRSQFKPLIQNNKSKHVQNKNILPVEGLLGKIAYSSKLMQDNLMAQKINHLMDNKIFINQLTKMFPEVQKQHEIKQNHGNQGNKNMKKKDHQGKQKQSKQLQYHDQLEMICNPSSITNQNNAESELSISSINQHQISAIQFNNNSMQQGEGQNSILSQPNQILEEFYKVDNQEEYADDRDYGYHEHVFDDSTLMEGCQELSKRFGYPNCAIKKEKRSATANFGSKQTKDEPYVKFRQSIEQVQKKKFPPGMIFPQQKDQTYPLEYNGVSYDIMKLKVIYDRQKIGYEEEKQWDLKKGDIIAGRYQIQKILGNGVFAKVIKVKDLSSEDSDQMTCFKIIQNDKDFFDQALDQLKILRYIKANCIPGEHFLLNFKQMFYHRQHLFIETDLLKQNLLTAFQTNPSYFSINVIKKISIQILQALALLHNINVIHADLKPQNIMIKSYNPIQIRVIDLGNGSFTHDKSLSNYVQSRSYRAPEVVLGCGWNQKIDIWSLGCIIAELWTKNVLFYNHCIQGMLARIQSIAGPWPEWMLQNGQNVVNLFSNQNFIYLHDKQSQVYHIFVPKKTTLKNRIRSDDELFIDFIKTLIEIDPMKRVGAIQALNHPFLRN